MARAAIACANDRTAELLLEAASFETGRWHKQPLVEMDAGAFALDLSRNAADQIADARKFRPTQDRAAFDQTTMAMLNPENQTPFWPRGSTAAHVEKWQGPDAPLVTLPFLLGIVRAARELEGDAYIYLNEVSGPNRSVIADVPGEFATTYDEISGIMSVANIDLQNVEISLPENRAAKLSPATSERALIYVHSGYIGMMTAYMAGICPPVLGPQFLPQR